MIRLRPAELLLQELGVDHPDDIDLDAIAYHLGCEIRYRRLEGCEARILGAGDRAIISISTDVRPARQRFSLGHELGHWHHHRGRSSFCRSDDIGNETRGPTDPERVADGYAADLLLPPYLVRPRLDVKTPPRFKQIEELAGSFRSSILASALRLVDLTPYDVVLVCHNQSGRRWFRRGPRVPDRWFPRQDLDADSYAFDVLNRDKDRSHVALMPASAWFERSEADRYELHEETIRIGGDEILTLLTIDDDGMTEEWSRSGR
jgi:hypothetical protein